MDVGKVIEDMGKTAFDCDHVMISSCDADLAWFDNLTRGLTQWHCQHACQHVELIDIN